MRYSIFTGASLALALLASSASADDAVKSGSQPEKQAAKEPERQAKERATKFNDSKAAARHSGAQPAS